MEDKPMPKDEVLPLPIPMEESESRSQGSHILQIQGTDDRVVYLIGSSLLEYKELHNILKSLCLQPILLEETFQTKLDSSLEYIYIFDEFKGSFFELLRKRALNNPKITIYGAPAVLSSFEIQRGLVQSPSGYPVYCLFLQNCTLSVTGMRSKEKMVEMRRKILYMGGLFLEKAVKVKYLMAEKVGGERYLDACAIAVPIMKPGWIDHLWSQRDNHRLDWETDLQKWTCKAFYSLKIAFEGFDDTTKSKLITQVTSRDGLVVEPDNPSATHVVVKTGTAALNSVQSRAVTSTQEDVNTLSIQKEGTEATQSNEHGGLTDLQSPTKRPRFDHPVCSDQCITPTSALVASARGQRDKVKIVKEEWFWTTLQVGYCTPEDPYLITNTALKQYDEVGNSSIGTPTGLLSPNNLPLSDTDGGTPGSAKESIGKRKRKRNKECLRHEFLSSLVLPDLPPKIITDISQCDAKLMNLGGNSLGTDEDVSDIVFGNILKQISDFLVSTDIKSMSSRQAEFAHLIETERNYVTILVNIVKNFKEPCEDPNQPGGAILEPLEIRAIFHTILPIYSLHRRLLRDLARLLLPWSEDNLIGKVYCDHATAFRKAYEPFVNFFEATKNEIRRCEEKDGRFMAFLKIAQSRPECGKQSLTDLMIRPIQRLPSTALILSALVKRTKEPNPDAEWMLKAVEAINSVNKAINEGKRVTEARIAMFDIYNEIDGCPVDIVSAQRSLQLRIEVNSLSETWGQKNDPLSLIVFNDSILIVKRRSTAGNKHLASVASVANLRSPSMSRKSILPGQPMQNLHNAPKPYKFLEMIYHVAIVRVVDIRDARCFGLIVREPHENRERVFGFTLPEDPSWPKFTLLHRLAKLAADAVDRLDYEIKLVTEDYSRLEFSVSTSTVLEKASRFANKTRHKVSRALSLSRTPSKLKRTVSQMLSPFSMSKAQQDSDTVSRASTDGPTTPLRSNTSSLSLWGFGTRRGDGTPKPRKTITDRESKPSFTTNGNFTSIQEA